MIGRRALLAAVLILGGCTGTEKDNGAVRPGPTSPSPSASNVAWRSCADAPTARQEVAAAALGTTIFVAGGLLDSGQNSSIVESYDTTSDRWASLPPLPIRVDHAMATVWQGKLVVLGGNGPNGPSNQVFAFESGRWSSLPRLQRARVAGAAVTVGSQIIVVGGVGPGDHVAPVEIFDGSAWRDGAGIPSLRDHLAAATDGRLVYAFGGRRAGAHIAAHEAYDPAADSWETLPAVPTARSGFGATLIRGKLVTAGGEGPRIFPEVEAYDPASKTWSRLPDMGVPRHGVGIVGVGSTLYALVGGAQVGIGATKTCERLDV